MERDEVHGADPADVAKSSRNTEDKEPATAGLVGKFDERMGIMASDSSLSNLRKSRQEQPRV